MEKLIGRVPNKQGDISSYIKPFDDYYKNHHYCDRSLSVMSNGRIENMLDGTLNDNELIITAIEFMENGTSLGRIMDYIASNHPERYNYETFQHMAKEYQRIFNSNIPESSKDRRTWKWEQWYHISLDAEVKTKELFTKLGLKWE